MAEETKTTETTETTKDNVEKTPPYMRIEWCSENKITSWTILDPEKVATVLEKIKPDLKAR